MCLNLPFKKAEEPGIKKREQQTHCWAGNTIWSFPNFHSCLCESASVMLMDPCEAWVQRDFRVSLFFAFKDFIYLFMKDTHTERGRGRSRLHAGSPTWDSIPGPRDHALSQMQIDAQPLSHPVPPRFLVLFLLYMLVSQLPLPEVTWTGLCKLYQTCKQMLNPLAVFLLYSLIFTTSVPKDIKDIFCILCSRKSMFGGKKLHGFSIS